MDGRLPRVRAAAMMLWAALAAAPGPAVALLTPDLRLCDGGATTGTCYQSLARSLSVRPPLLGTAYFSGVCTLGYPCLPTDHPIADWVTVTVLNGGTAQAVAMTVGLYISDELVTLSNGALGCHVDVTFPAANATSVGTGSVGPLQVGERVSVVFEPASAVMSWAVGDAAPRGDRTAMTRCLIVYADNGNSNYEAEPDSRNNIGYAVVQLVDTVDLKAETFEAGFDALPWLQGTVQNAGVTPAPPFFVDFYAFTRGRYVQVRPVYPLLVREPSPSVGYDTVCLGMVVDAQNQVPEPFEDGLDNFGVAVITNEDLIKFLHPIVIPQAPKDITLMVALISLAGVLVAALVGYRCYVGCRDVRARQAEALETKRRTAAHAAEVAALHARHGPRLPPEAVRKLGALAERGNPGGEGEAGDAKDAALRSRYKDGVIRDADGAEIAFVDAEGIIRDTAGVKIGVSAAAVASSKSAKSKVYSAYFK